MNLIPYGKTVRTALEAHEVERRFAGIVDTRRKPDAPLRYVFWGPAAL